MKRWILWAAISLLLYGCGQPVIRALEPVRVEDWTLVSPVDWSQYGTGRERIWTRDGVALNRLMLIRNVRDGEHVFLKPKDRSARRGEGALYRSGMTDPELVELVADGLRSMGAESLQIETVEPLELADAPGFLARLQFQNRPGLHFSALLAGQADAKGFSFMLFHAPALHYFPRDVDAVLALIRSIRAN